MGCGLAGLNYRVIYLFQKDNSEFTKISYYNKFIEQNRPERDLDGDGNFEILTMALNRVDNHNYWTFQIYEYTEHGLVNSNKKYDYPIMIQFLYRENYAITDHFGRDKMKEFDTTEPIDYDIQ